MTMMIHTAAAAPIRPPIGIKLGFIAKIAKYIFQAHRHSHEAQNLLRTHDTILQDIGLTRVKANGKSYLFSPYD